MHVPLIDCEPQRFPEHEIAARIDGALRSAGFMAVTGLGVDASAVARMFAVSRRFFASGEDVKDRCAYGAAAENFGYQGLLVESLDPRQAPDLKETFTMRNPRRAAISGDRWPDEDFRRAVVDFYGQAMAAAQRLQRLLALALKVPEEFFVDCHGGENITLRLLHYPAVKNTVPSVSQMGAGAHTDYGMLTLLMQDDVGGLEVQDDKGQWHPVPPRPDAVLINSGDLLERWSNGRYRSTCHRVQPVTGERDRFSIALFVDPDSATRVEVLASCVSDENPVRFEPTSAGAHLQEKIEATHRG